MLVGLKIAVGYQIRNGPWGGGNQFLASFKDYFEARGAKITNRLEDKADLVLLINPRKGSGTFDYYEVKRYKRRNPKAKIIYRVNDTDKTNRVYKADRLRLKACQIADGVVFVSNWIKDYYMHKGFNSKIPHVVIKNGADENIFNPEGKDVWQGRGPLRIVTHHWSGNWAKGADIYQYFDQLLADPWMRRHFAFTYIGQLPNYPFKLEFRNTHCITPLSGLSLAQELKKHHVYLTAARWEGCGMHQIEGALCGLPALFIDEGGGVVETCRGFGIEFTKDTFVLSLFKMSEQYADLEGKMKDFPLKASLMNRRYEEFIVNILKHNPGRKNV